MERCYRYKKIEQIGQIENIFDQNAEDSFCYSKKTLTFLVKIMFLNLCP